MEQPCKICGKMGVSKNYKAFLCSPECRKENKKRYDKVYINPHKKPYTHKWFICKICGEPVNKSRKRYHDECIIQEYIEACNEGAGRLDLRKCRFYNSGFIKEDAEEFKARFQTEEV